MRIAALMAAGAFGLHQLRFTLWGEDAQAVHGHGYLTVAAPLLAGLLLLALTIGLARLVRGAGERSPSLRRVWAGASGALIAVYCLQESIEGQHALFGHGGWIALPLAVLIGLAVAVVVRESAHPLVTRAPRPYTPSRPLSVLIAPPRTPPARVAFVAFPARGPPQPSV